MRYGDEDRESKNVEDRRGEGGGLRSPAGAAASKFQSAAAALVSQRC